MARSALPELPPLVARHAWLGTLLGERDALLEENQRLHREIQGLREEVARLKGHKGKPQIKPSRLNKSDKTKAGGRPKSEGEGERPVDRTEIVKAAGVPAGSRFKGYADYVVQELVIKPRHRPDWLDKTATTSAGTVSTISIVNPAAM